MKKAIKLQEQGFEFSVAGSLMKLLSVFFRYKNIASEKRINKSGYERISNIIKYINNNYSDNIQLSALAERFYISEFYMCRLFKEYTGKSVISYITIARITKAKNLLVNTNTRINLIYKQCGFGSLSNCNRCFKELCGKTPMQYRKTNK